MKDSFKKSNVRKILPESKKPAKKIGFTTNIPLFLWAFDYKYPIIMIIMNHGHHDHHDHGHHDRHDHHDYGHHDDDDDKNMTDLPSFSQRNPLSMCPPTAATAPTLRMVLSCFLFVLKIMFYL